VIFQQQKKQIYGGDGFCSIVAHGIEAVVLPDNALSHTLLGMSFLSRMSKFEMNKGRLVLER
jgi:aspartyl protease family protein